MKRTPAAKSAVASVMKTIATRSKFGATAGARNAHTCHRRTGRTIAIAAITLTFTEVVNGSVTPKVTRFLSSGSGTVSHSTICSWNANATANAGTIAKRLTISRERSSSRCSTRVASSPWSRRRGSQRRMRQSG